MGYYALMVFSCNSVELGVRDTDNGDFLVFCQFEEFFDKFIVDFFVNQNLVYFLVG